jgi:hypothetical protein
LPFEKWVFRFGQTVGYDDRKMFVAKTSTYEHKLLNTECVLKYKLHTLMLLEYCYCWMHGKLTIGKLITWVVEFCFLIVFRCRFQGETDVGVSISSFILRSFVYMGCRWSSNRVLFNDRTSPKAAISSLRKIYSRNHNLVSRNIISVALLTTDMYHLS